MSEQSERGAAPGSDGRAPRSRDAAAIESTVTGELRRLLRLAWPVVIGQLGAMMMGVVDTAMVGQLGADALAAISLGHTWTFGIMVIAIGTVGGMDPVVSQAFGADDRQAAGRGLVQGCTLALLLALPVGLLCAVAGPGLRLLRQPEAVIPIAAQYAAIVGLSAAPNLLFEAIRRLLQGDGQMKPIAAVVLLCNAINAAANWAFIHGLGPVPAMGAAGVAWSTLATRVAMVLMLAWAGRGLIRDCWPGIRGSLGGIGRLLAIGLPIGLQIATEVWAFGASTMLMGWIGATAVAAHSVALNLTSVAFMVPFGISTAAAARVGNLLGAGADWTRAGWTAVGMGASVMCGSAFIFATFPEALVSLYTPAPEVIALAVTLMPLAALFQVFDGTQAVTFGVLRGVGDTRFPALINLIGYWLLGLPIGAALAFWFGMGARGIWMGLVIGLVIVATLVVLRLRWTARRGGFRV